MVTILERGINVVSSVLLPALYPDARHVSPRSTQQLAQACERGDSSLFISGIDPGFATDELPVMLTSICGRVDRIRMMEIMSYEHYDDADTQFRWFGFGAPIDSELPPYLAPGRLTRYWGPTVELVAAGIGVEIDEIRETTDRLATAEALEVDAGRIEPGTVGALRFAVQGFHADKEVVTLEHITRLHPSVAPEWPQPMVPDGVYRIVIEGWPSYELNLFGTDEHGENYPALEAATAFRIVNRIPDVCDAAPGILDPFAFGLVRNPWSVPRLTRRVCRVSSGAGTEWAAWTGGTCSYEAATWSTGPARPRAGPTCACATAASPRSARTSHPTASASSTPGARTWRRV